MSINWPFPDDTWWASIHEAGHAVCAMAVGIQVESVRVDEYGGGCCTTFTPTGPDRPYHCYYELAGYLAVALLAPNADKHFRSWEVLKTGDLAAFHKGRMGVTFRHARRKVIKILQERREATIKIAEELYRTGKVDLTKSLTSS